MDPGLASWTVPQVGEVVSRDWDAGSTGTGLSCAARKRLRGVADGEFEQGDRETGRSELVGSGPESKSSALPVSLSPCSILRREKEVAPNEESIADRERLRSRFPSLRQLRRAPRRGWRTTVRSRSLRPRR